MSTTAFTRWTPAQRAITALTLGKPDEIPTFELEFQLSPEMFGKDFLYSKRDLEGKSLSKKEIDYKIEENANFMVEVYDQLEYSIIPVAYLSHEHTIETAKHINRVTGGKV